MTIRQRDVHIGVCRDTPTGDVELIVRRRNPEITAWELYAARHHLPTNAPTLALTWQAWRALRTNGDTTDDFDTWAADVIEVYPVTANGDRLIARDGVLYTEGNEPVDVEDGIEADPTR